MKYLTLLLTFLALTFFAAFDSGSAEAAKTPITLSVNDKIIKTDAEPFLSEGLTYVPIRFVGEALGAETVAWDQETDSAVIQHEGTRIVLPKDKKGGYVNGRFVPIESGVKLVKDRVFVPVRFVSETLDCQVDWIYHTYTVSIKKSGIHVPESLIDYRDYTDDEIYWLSKIIHAESQGEPMAGKIAVGNIVLNRVESDAYPNTIYGVIFDKSGGVQFSPVLDGSIYQNPYGDSIIAAKRALEGENPVANCLFFLNPRHAESTWIIHNRPYYTTIANHDFYL